MSSQIIGSTALMNTYGLRPLTLVRGEGAYVWDNSGKRYLDALAGIAVCGLGHAHQRVTEAISKQASALVHCSNLYNIPEQQQFAEVLQRVSGMDKLFFGNSGAEANEAAIKLARLHGHRKGIDLPTIIVTDNAFHGRTLATLTATGNRKVHAGFEPLVRGFTRAPYNDIEAIATIASNNPNISAVLVEPIQGEGGIQVPDPDYLKNLRALCDKHDWLLILDEIQTGNGRTGAFFNYQLHNILPDVATLSKGLGNGFPIGACFVHGKAKDLFQPGNHGSTFGGNPVACAAGLATVNTIIDQGLEQTASERGKLLKQGLRDELSACEHVLDIRGEGLMLGIELDMPCAELVSQAAEQGLLINVTAEKVVRLLPPLIFSEGQVQQVIETLAPLVRNFKQAR